MKRTQYFLTTLTLGALIIFFSGCKKQSIYHDYVNVTQTFNGTGLDYLKAQPKGTFDSLLLVLDRVPDLRDSINTRKVTLFAPVNASFISSLKYVNLARASDNRAPINLTSADESSLRYLLRRYIIRGNLTEADYAGKPDGIDVSGLGYDYLMHIDERKLTASGFEGGGATYLEFSDTYGSIFRPQWVTTKTTSINIKTNNAIINILTPLHNFGFDEFTNVFY